MCRPPGVMRIAKDAPNQKHDCGAVVPSQTRRVNIMSTGSIDISAMELFPLMPVVARNAPRRSNRSEELVACPSNGRAPADASDTRCPDGKAEQVTAHSSHQTGRIRTGRIRAGIIAWDLRDRSASPLLIVLKEHLFPVDSP